MRFLNYCAGVSSIKYLFIIDSDQFVSSSVKANLIAFLPEAVRNNVAVCTPKEGDTIQHVTEVINKLNKDAVICVGDKDIYKYYSTRNTPPKNAGSLIKSKPIIEERYIQYFNFTSDALYLQAHLIHKEDCMRHIYHHSRTGKVLETNKKRRLIIPKTTEEVKKMFKYLHKFDCLGADIETTSLKFYEAELVSISFATNQTDGFTLHAKLTEEFMGMLRKFFLTYKGRLVWHNGSYDLKVLAHLLFDDDSRPLYRTFEDSMFLHFICTNSPERFPRDLGTLVVSLCGEYKLTKAQYKDMMNVDPQLVCEYNLDDARGTIWLYHQYRRRIHSEYLYSKMKEWQWSLTQIELKGIPICKEQVVKVDKQLSLQLKSLKLAFKKHPLVVEAAHTLREINLRKINAKLVNPKGIHEIPLDFNPKSGPQLSVLLYHTMGFDCTVFTKAGKKSTSAGTIQALSAKATDDQKEVFKLIIDIAEVSTMLGTFVKALKTATREKDGWLWLHGNYNLARVVSGRLSSSDPNLQNLPSSSTLSKIFKSCFVAPEGWLWGGADYASLEERINTILTRDPNKEAVYHLGYDGHSFRAYHYFTDQLKEISDQLAMVERSNEIFEVTKGDHKYYYNSTDHKVPDDITDYVQVTLEKAKVGIINNIEFDFGKIRKKSKSPTFLLQYLGTAFGLIKTCGFTKEEAEAIYANYYKLYAVSAAWLDKEIKRVAAKGYAEVAFGLRIYSYGIANSILDSDGTPKTITEFIRTLGNAIGGQSYGQLTVDAGMKFLKRVYEAGLEKDVFLSATIHDANYPIWRDDPKITEWVNINLIECMMDTSEHPELNSSSIPLPAKLEVHVLNWATPVALPNNIKADEITQYLVDNYTYD